MNSTHETTPFPPTGEADEAGRNTEGENGDKGFAARFSLRILIAEDDYITRRRLRLLLENLGYTIQSVENGQECLEEATRQTYDLVLLDLDMPVLDGVDCARQMRYGRIASAIVALTSVPVQVARLASLGAGINAYLEKPIKMEDLKQTLRVACFNRAYSST
jgi:CheY-like chemotaxis protein